MTTEQKNCIRELRDQGLSYVKVAAELNMSINTVKAFCQRHLRGITVQKAMSAVIAGVCKQCGQPLIRRAKSKPRQFCSDACRLTWWKSHPEHLNRKAFYSLTCAHCGQSFQSYGNRDRKYCGRSCFSAGRKGASS